MREAQIRGVFGKKMKNEGDRVKKLAIRVITDIEFSDIKKKVLLPPKSDEDFIFFFQTHFS